MKELAGRLAALLDVPASDIIELHRALREHVADSLQLSISIPLPPDLFDVTDALVLLGNRLIGKTGPGGGTAGDPVVITLLLIALSLDGTRRAVAVKVGEVLAAKWVSDYTAEPEGFCTLTGKKYFGEALMAIFSADNADALVNRVVRIDVEYDIGRVTIFYSSDDDAPQQTSQFIFEPTLSWPKAIHRVGRITFIALGRLREFIKGNPDFVNFAQRLKAETEAMRDSGREIRDV